MALTEAQQQRARHYGFTVVASVEVPTAAVHSDGRQLMLNMAWVETISPEVFEIMLHHEWGHSYLLRTAHAARIFKRALAMKFNPQEGG